MKESPKSEEPPTRALRRDEVPTRALRMPVHGRRAQLAVGDTRTLDVHELARLLNAEVPPAAESLAGAAPARGPLLQTAPASTRANGMGASTRAAAPPNALPLPSPARAALPAAAPAAKPALRLETRVAVETRLAASSFRAQDSTRRRALPRFALGLLLVAVPLASAVAVMLILRASEPTTRPVVSTVPAGQGAPAAELTPKAPSDPRATGTGHEAATRSPASPPSSAPPPAAVPSARSTALPQPAASPRLAVNALAEGRYEDALLAYRALASAAPERSVYADLVQILERKLAARCAKRAETGEDPCTSLLR